MTNKRGQAEKKRTRQSGSLQGCGVGVFANRVVPEPAGASCGYCGGLGDTALRCARGQKAVIPAKAGIPWRGSSIHRSIRSASGTALGVPRGGLPRLQPCAAFRQAAARGSTLRDLADFATVCTRENPAMGTTQGGGLGETALPCFRAAFR